MTQRQQDALTIIGDNPCISAREFSNRFWPGHTCNTKVTRGGDGAQSGKTGWLMAGSYLAKLIKKGWIRRGYRFERLGDRGYHLSSLGKELLNNKIDSQQ